MNGSGASKKKKRFVFYWFDDSCFFNQSSSVWFVSSSTQKSVNNSRTTSEAPWRDLYPPHLASQLWTPQWLRLASISASRLNRPISFPISGPLSWRISDRAVLLKRKCHKVNDTCYWTITSNQAETLDWFHGRNVAEKWVILGSHTASNPFLWLQYK